MELEHLLGKISHKIRLIKNYKNVNIENIAYNSKKISQNGLFFALKGEKTDGRKYIYDSVSRGAKVVVTTEFSHVPDDVSLIVVKDIEEVMGILAYTFYELDKAFFNVSFVTGTNGKTSITYMVESIFNANGVKIGIIGTVNYRLGGKIVEKGLTTPLSLDLFKIIRRFINEGATEIFMELSSHAIVQKRYFPLNFECGVFTNVSHEHLDYHKTFENYKDVKKSAFFDVFARSNKKKAAIVNIDDPVGAEIAAGFKGRTVTYSLYNSEGDVMPLKTDFGIRKTEAVVKLPDNSVFNISSSLIGYHNMYNFLAAAGFAHAKGVSSEIIEKGLRQLKTIPGRLERVSEEIDIFVDYAHSPDALLNLLKAVRLVTDKKIAVVFGAGGDRDRTKRPLMGEVVEKYADFAIVTSDNPRSEDPDEIIKDILKGMKGKNYTVIPDRREAIKEGVKLAKNGMVLLVCGKGHEDYQILKDRVIHFDDKEVVREFL